MNVNRTINELKYKIGYISNLARVEYQVFGVANISIITESLTDSYRFLRILTAFYGFKHDV